MENKITYTSRYDKWDLFRRFDSCEKNRIYAGSSSGNGSGVIQISPFFLKEFNKNKIQYIRIYMARYTIDYLVTCEDHCVTLMKKDHKFYIYQRNIGLFISFMTLLLSPFIVLGTKGSWPSAAVLFALGALGLISQLSLSSFRSKQIQKELDEYMKQIIR